MRRPRVPPRDVPHSRSRRGFRWLRRSLRNDPGTCSRSIERTEFREITRESIDQPALLSLCRYLGNPGSSQSFVSAACRWLHSGNARTHDRESKIAAPAIGIEDATSDAESRGKLVRSCDLVLAMLLDTARLIEDLRDSRRVYFADVYSRGARIEEGRSNQLPRSSTESHYSEAASRARSSRLCAGGFTQRGRRSVQTRPIVGDRISVTFLDVGYPPGKLGDSRQKKGRNDARP